MKRFLAATALVVVALGVFVLSDSASATNGVLDSFTAAYPATAGTGLDSCSTCHTSVPALNAYGSALRAGDMNFAAIEGVDSDGDGFSNLQEIRNLTNPGSAGDRPITTTSPTTATTTTSTTSTTAAGGPQPVSVSQTPATQPPATAAGASGYEAGAAGTVWLAIEDGFLVVSRVDTAWHYEIEMDDDNEIEIKFRSGDREIEFEAELEDGSIRTKLEVESDDDHSRSGDDDHDGVDHDDDREDRHSRSDDDREDDHDDSNDDD